MRKSCLHLACVRPSSAAFSPTAAVHPVASTTLPPSRSAWTLKLSAQISAWLLNSALTHPQAVARTLGTPTKGQRPDRLNDEFRPRRKIEAFLSDISFGSNDVVLFYEFLECRDVFRRRACGRRR